MIDDYFFAEATYQKIPEVSDYFIDAQRNIAFNYSQENGFDNVENKIKVIVKNNNEDYEITKILADFYRIEKKYDLHSSSIRDDRRSMSGKFMVFLRNIKSNIKKILYSDKYKYPVW